MVKTVTKTRLTKMSVYLQKNLSKSVGGAVGIGTWQGLVGSDIFPSNLPPRRSQGNRHLELRLVLTKAWFDLCSDLCAIS